jgi:hypothetical protein
LKKDAQLQSSLLIFAAQRVWNQVLRVQRICFELAWFGFCDCVANISAKSELTETLKLKYSFQRDLIT